MLIWCKLSWLCSIQWSSSNCDQLKAVPLFYLRWWKAEPLWVWMCGGCKFHLLAFYLLWVGRGHWNGYVVFSLPSPGKRYVSVSAAALLCAGEHLLLYRWGVKELACCFTDRETNAVSAGGSKPELPKMQLLSKRHWEGQIRGLPEQGRLPVPAAG